MKIKITPLTLSCLLILSSICVFSVHASTPDSMRIEPPLLSFSTSSTPVGTKFNVTIWLNMATPANNWQFYLIYKKAYLNTTASGYTGNGKSLWSGTNPTDNPAPATGAHNATHDYLLWGEVLKNSAQKTGEDSLVWVEFQIMQAPPSGQTLTSDIRIDIDGIFNSAVYDKTFNPISLTFGKATYSYGSIWEPPPAAKLFVDPSAVLNRSLTPSNNFTIDVKISKATTVASFDFNLTFNATVVKAYDVTLGDFFPPSSTWSAYMYPSGYVHVNATLNAAVPPKNGSGTLVTIKFQVQAIGNTILHLTDIILQDDQAHTLPSESADGNFNNAALPGDVNGDGKVEITDIAIVSAAFGSYDMQPPSNHARWDSRADINHDGRVDIFDRAVVQQSYGLYG